MKEQIRNSIWETNSSAVHSLSVCSKGLSNCRLKVCEDGYVHIDLDQEFGKETKIYSGQKDKLKYIVSWIYSYYDFNTEEIKDSYIWRDFNETFAKYVNTHHPTDIPRLQEYQYHICKGVKVDKSKFKDGYEVFDHQLQPLYHNYSGCVVDLWDALECVKFVFNKYAELKTGCD